MTLTLGFLIFVLFFVNTFQLANRRKLLKEIDGLKIEAKSKALPTDDIEIKAYLEAQATTSPLAKKLLAASQIEMLPGEPVAVDDAWMHDTKAKLPLIQFWENVKREYACETDDASRVQCIKRWTEGGRTFTSYEKSLLLAEVMDSGKRDEMRAVLFPAKKPDVPAKTPAFRWSKQPNKVLLMATCQHGKPASSFFLDTKDGRRVMRFGCNDGCSKSCTRHYEVDSDFIWIFASGNAWATIDGRWLKVAID